MRGMNEPSHDESHQRLNERLQRYWDEVREDRDIADESQINPDHIAEIWPSCFLINAQEKRFRYDYLGPDLIEAYGSDISGQEICEALVYPDSPTLFNAMQHAIKARCPVEDRGEFVNHLGATIRYRCLVLPLSRNFEQAPSFILGGMRWKWYSRYENTTN